MTTSIASGTEKSDDELMEAVQNGDIEYENNNWIEAFVKSLMAVGGLFKI